MQGRGARLGQKTIGYSKKLYGLILLEIMGENDTPARGIMDLRPPAGLLKLPASDLSCLKATISCQRAVDR